jgi:hypothetical protein
MRRGIPESPLLEIARMGFGPNNTVLDEGPRHPSDGREKDDRAVQIGEGDHSVFLAG